MDREQAELDSLTRAEQDALRTLLIEATAAADRPSRGRDLTDLVEAAPVELLPDAAMLHRVPGLVLRGLEGVAGVPDAVTEELTMCQQQAALFHLRHLGALSEICRAFDDARVRWVVMKGPVVAALLYRDVGDRIYGDLDLVVDRRDYGTAMELLEELGYEHTMHNWARAEQMLAGQVSMKSPAVSVDLHWHLHYSHADRRPFAIEPEAMIERVRRVLVSGLSTPTVDAVDTLWSLGFHAARSDGHRLLWLKDVERSVAVEAPDYDELVARCRRYRIGPPVGLILDRSRRLLGADIPVEVVDALASASLRAADRGVCMLSDPIQLHERPTIARSLTRSVRSSMAASAWELPARATSSFKRVFIRRQENETDDPVEKAHYVSAVSASLDP